MKGLEEAKKNLLVNVATNVLSVLTTAMIGLWLTAYLIKNLGVAVYGIVPLAVSVVAYFGLFTLLIASTVGRFVSLHLDIVKHANVPRNLEIFDELVALFRTREDIPASDEFPNVKPGLESYKFPDDVLTSKRLLTALGSDRIELIRRSIVENNRSDSVVKYVVPWFDSNIMEKESVDMIYSQAVLEHVDDLRHTYEALYSWLKPNGFMSHQIDFKSHGTASKWNGHWTYSDLAWRLIRGNRPYLLSREPYSTHIKLLKDTGFRKIWEQKMLRQSEIDRRDLAKKFRNISQEDLNISGAFIQALK